MWFFKPKCTAFDEGGYGHRVLCREPAVSGTKPRLCPRHLASFTAEPAAGR